MVSISVIISNGYQFLMYKSIESEKTEHSFPFVKTPTLLGAKRKLKKDIKNIGVSFFFDKEIHSETQSEETHYVFLCHANEYMFSLKDDNYIWVDIEKIKEIALNDTYRRTNEIVLKYIDDRQELIYQIEEKINSFHDQSIVKLEFSKKLNGLQVFINTPEFRCAYSYLVAFDFVNENELEYSINWILNSSIAPGDKSDIYILFSETMAIILKLFLQEPVCVAMFGHCFIDGEIGGAQIAFESDGYSGRISKNEIVKRIVFSFEVFNMVMGVHGGLIGSISHNNIENTDEDILKCFNKQYVNYVCREEHACYYDNRMECIYIDNGIYDANELFKEYSYEIITGTHGKILVQKTREFTFLNYIDNDDWDIVQKIIKRRKIVDYKLLAQSNKLYVIANKEIWVINGWFHHTIAELEKEDVLDRNKREQALLLANREFGWKYPLNYSRFEELCADLLEQIKPNARIRLAGDANNADGGRDILVYNSDDTLHICQCKAYQRNVGKSDVQDIRDTIEFHGATGFHLMVSSRITSPLIKHLELLKQKYSVDWWTEREIFNYLRRYPFIADRYRDILEIK